ncbi:hypothetical protein SNEBB_010681, partial [Seison nebaliae]
VETFCHICECATDPCEGVICPTGRVCKFSNYALRQLPISIDTINSQRKMPNICYSLVEPTAISKPKLVGCSFKLLQELGLLDKQENEISVELLNYLCGNKIFPGSQPAAHCYCGHQFGSFAGQLGDGATMYLGQLPMDEGKLVELQLKGAGKTPFSRAGDGRKILRSSLREFLCSEFFHHLGIPTSRSASCIVSLDMTVTRDPWNNGELKQENCAVITRIAETFIRFGSFEISKEDNTSKRRGPSFGNQKIIHQLFDYVIENYFPEHKNAEKKYNKVFEEIVNKTAYLVACWQSVGWIHGVLNTDNMSIIGNTIDYGPFGFMEYFVDDYTGNTSDSKGRYCYKKQPSVCKWNLLKLLESLKEIVDDGECQRYLERNYDEIYEKNFYRKMSIKVGMKEVDKELVDDLLEILNRYNIDWTFFFQVLSSLTNDKDDSLNKNQMIELIKTYAIPTTQYLESVYVNKINFWYQNKMEEVSPSFFFNQSSDFLEDMIDEDNNFANIRQILKLKKNPIQFELALSTDLIRWLDQYDLRMKRENNPTEQQQLMKSSNPRFILRNDVINEIVDELEKDLESNNFFIIEELMKMLEDPFDIAERYPPIHHIQEVYEKFPLLYRFQMPKKIKSVRLAMLS